jgi:acyl-CoA thioesterase-1
VDDAYAAGMAERGHRWALLRCAASQLGFLALGAAVRRFRVGLAQTRGQLHAFAALWDDANRHALDAEGPLWVVLGDSTAQGIGATVETGYVAQLRAFLEARDGRAWRVVNLSRSGARAAGVDTTQLPALAALGVTPDLVTCAVGANDLLRTPMPQLLASLRRIIDGLPDKAVIATLPQGLATRRALRVNAVIGEEAAAAGLRVADVWAHTGAPWQGKYADDFFHPNVTGYADWARAFADALDLE